MIPREAGDAQVYLTAQRPTKAASPSRGPVTWRQLLPADRLPVVAKTPVLVVLGASCARGVDNARGVWLSMALAAALWVMLYALNECSDAVLEAGYTDNRCVRPGLLIAAAALVGVAGCISPRLLGLLALMVASQVAYCLPPLRLKRWWWGSLLLSGTVNPVTRVQCGAIWGTRPLPALVYVVLLFLHLGAAIRTRTLQRRRDRMLSYTVPPPGAEWIGMLCTAAGIGGTYLACSRALFPSAFAPFVTIGAVFAAYAWSRSDLRMGELRRAWIAFALLSLIVIRAFYQRHFVPDETTVTRSGPHALLSSGVQERWNIRHAGR